MHALESAVQAAPLLGLAALPVMVHRSQQLVEAFLSGNAKFRIFMPNLHLHAFPTLPLSLHLSITLSGILSIAPISCRFLLPRTFHHVVSHWMSEPARCQGFFPRGSRMSITCLEPPGMCFHNDCGSYG